VVVRVAEDGSDEILETIKAKKQKQKLKKKKHKKGQTA